MPVVTPPSVTRSFWLLAAYICLVFLIGGSSRFDVASLAILRPLSAITVCIAIWLLREKATKSHRSLLIFAAAVILVVGIQLIPLPPAIWTSLPGRELAASADAALGLEAHWRPISLAPSATWNALFSLLVPLSVLLLAINLDKTSLYRLVPVMLAIILLSGILGILQTLGPDRGPLYFYRLTNWGASVGLLANRNHQSVLLACAFPLLAVFASWKQGDTSQVAMRRMWGAGCAGLLLVPMIIATGSRAGLLVGTLALASVPWIYRGETRKNNSSNHNKFGRLKFLNDYWLHMLALAVIASLFALVFFGRDQIFQMGSQDIAGDLRFEVFRPIMGMIVQYFPVGTGFGAFPEAYRIAEPDALLNSTYLNHAHNDWLEVVVTGGLFSLVLLTIVIVYAIRKLIALYLLPTDQQRLTAVVMGKAGLTIIFLGALASVFDYPIRVPSMSVLMVLAFVWLYSSMLTTEKKLEGRGDVV